MNINDIQTPFFLLDRKVMVDEVQKLNYAIATYWPNTIPAYSVMIVLIHSVGIKKDKINRTIAD